MMRRFLRAAAAAALALCACAASAATITVDSSVDDDLHCTLRNAVATATDNTLHGTCAVGTASNTIVFSPVDFNATPFTTVTVGSPAINIDNALNFANASLVIQGNGPAGTIIDAANHDRVFDNFDSGVVNPISITWQDLSIIRGNAIFASRHLQ